MPGDVSYSSQDGWIVQEVGDWAESKYRLVEEYAALFAETMKGKWHTSYIDLFAGAGRARLKDTGVGVDTCATRALSIEPSFDSYLFCDLDSAKIEALERRVGISNPSSRVRFLNGDANDIAPELEAILRPLRRNRRVLSFCVLDPYRIRNLKFSTIRGLARFRMDFLILIPSHMDINRNESHYLAKGHRNLSDFLGSDTWDEEWSRLKSRPRFGNYIADYFSRQMADLGYSFGGFRESQLVRHTSTSAPLYRLGFFSRSPLGEKFWRIAQSRIEKQRMLF